MQTFTNPSSSAEMIRTLSIALIVFGTAAAALAVPASKQPGRGLLTRISGYFFGDRALQVEKKKQEMQPATIATDPSSSPAATSRREIDNFDLSIFEEF